MKKLLIIFFVIPGFIYGQDVPLTEKKVTTKSMENKERKLQTKNDKKRKKLTKKYTKKSAMHPKRQIGYITNLNAHPYGGANLFLPLSKHIGLYCDWRPSRNHLHNANYSDFYDGNENITRYGETLWIDIFNYGVSLCISNTRSTALMIYGGTGTAISETYMAEYDEYNIISGDWWYYADGGSITNVNYNYGILLQMKSGISLQVGWDTAIPGSKINYGLGFLL